MGDDKNGARVMTFMTRGKGVMALGMTQVPVMKSVLTPMTMAVTRVMMLMMIIACHLLLYHGNVHLYR